MYCCEANAFSCTQHTMLKQQTISIDLLKKWGKGNPPASRAGNHANFFVSELNFGASVCCFFVPLFYFFISGLNSFVSELKFRNKKYDSFVPKFNFAIPEFNSVAPKLSSGVQEFISYLQELNSRALEFNFCVPEFNSEGQNPSFLVRISIFSPIPQYCGIKNHELWHVSLFLKIQT